MSIVFRFPRLYTSVLLFGRTFFCDLGWVKADHNDTWKISLEIIPLARIGEGQGSMFYSSVTFTLGNKALSIEAGVE